MLSRETDNGTTRWRRLHQSELPPLGDSPLRVDALRLARLELEPLAGRTLEQVRRELAIDRSASHQLRSVAGRTETA